MTLYWTLAMLLIFAQIGRGETAEQVHKQLEDAAAAKGTLYTTSRNALVNLGSNAVPRLVEISANANEPWQVRLMAGIVAERIQRPAEIASLTQTNWHEDPEYNTDWDRNREGPVLGLAPLVTKRYREKTLWWSYMELIWKETGEHSHNPKMHEWAWRGIARQACENCSTYDLLVKVLEERIRADVEFKNRERWGEFEFLLNSKTNTPLPFLLEIIPLAPVKNPEVTLRKAIQNMAQPEDASLIEKHYTDKGQDIPAMLREPLRHLKERQNRSAAVP